MTTVLVVKIAGTVAIAADTLVTFGDTRLSARFEANSKLFKIEGADGPSVIGMAGTVAHFPALRKAMTALPQAELKLGSRDAVYDTFLKLHPVLKETFFLQTKEDDNDPYESSQFSVVIANAHGIFACTATAKSLNSRNSGALDPAAALRWVPCTLCGTKPKPPKTWRWLAWPLAVNSTKTRGVPPKFLPST